MYKKNIFCYILCGILKPATLRSEEIYSILEDCQTKYFLELVSKRLVIFSDLKELFLYITRNIFHTFCLIYPALSDVNFLGIGFHMTCHLFRISRKCKYFKLCFPHFLFDIPSSFRRKLSKYWFPQDLSYFQISWNCKYLIFFCFTHFMFDIPISVRQKISK